MPSSMGWVWHKTSNSTHSSRWLKTKEPLINESRCLLSSLSFLLKAEIRRAIKQLYRVHSARFLAICRVEFSKQLPSLVAALWDSIWDLHSGSSKKQLMSNVCCHSVNAVIFTTLEAKMSNGKRVRMAPWSALLFADIIKLTTTGRPHRDRCIHLHSCAVCQENTAAM